MPFVLTSSAATQVACNGLFRDLLSKQITHTESLFAGYNADYAEASSTFLLYCLTSGKNCESLVFVFAFSLRKIEIPRTLREIVFFYVSAESRSTPVVRASTKRWYPYWSPITFTGKSKTQQNKKVIWGWIKVKGKFWLTSEFKDGGN